MVARKSLPHQEFKTIMKRISNNDNDSNDNCQDVPSTPGKPLIMSFDSTSVELSWSPPLHHHHR